MPDTVFPRTAVKVMETGPYLSSAWVAVDCMEAAVAVCFAARDCRKMVAWQ